MQHVLVVNCNNVINVENITGTLKVIPLKINQINKNNEQLVKKIFFWINKWTIKTIESICHGFSVFQMNIFKH